MYPLVLSNENISYSSRELIIPRYRVDAGDTENRGVIYFIISVGACRRTVLARSSLRVYFFFYCFAVEKSLINQL